MALWLHLNILLRLIYKIMKHLWIIVQGLYFSEGYPLCVCKTKGIAVELCRSDGFEYYKNDDQWDNGEQWREVDRIDYLDGG